MYRSGSSTRVSDEFFSNPSSADAEQQQQQQLLLPTYNPESHLAKKEKIRLRSAEAAVHLIPVLLIICAVILWFFSAPGTASLSLGFDFECSVCLLVFGVAIEVGSMIQF
ncbi:hypothetical protein C2S52_005581 [Perilla frutescens var. hirtella]|uniref:Transmembrane protein n=1 Tax=Perilla frutescens var. hirtella TaxID=608512 RepID=A0AAD4J9U3_PERFH|nr:hypothetical protein C2S52_005581 [Perilla frutescens var. hirtella]KAH6829846.1 hypothetical protein C2S53_005046 [Perilla frutescens var. hirtella]